MYDRQSSGSQQTYRGRQADRWPPPSREHGPLNRRAVHHQRGEKGSSWGYWACATRGSWGTASAGGTHTGRMSGWAVCCFACMVCVLVLLAFFIFVCYLVLLLLLLACLVRLFCMVSGWSDCLSVVCFLFVFFLKGISIPYPPTF